MLHFSWLKQRPRSAGSSDPAMPKGPHASVENPGSAPGISPSRTPGPRPPEETGNGVPQSQGLESHDHMFRGVVEALPTMIHVMEGPDLKAAYANPAFVALTGRALEDMSGCEPWFQILIPDEAYRDKVRTAFLNHVGKAQLGLRDIEPMEIWVVGADGGLKCLQLTFNSMASRVCILGLDLTERRQAEQQLERVLAVRTQDWQSATCAALLASEEESRRIGRELHDTLCQDLIGLCRQAEALSLRRDGILADSAALNTKLHWMAETASAAARRARELSYLLAVSEPVDAPFEHVLRGHMARIESLYGITASLSLDDQLPPLSPDQQMHIIRLVREAMVNAARHGKARNAWVDGLRQGGETVFSVSSDGRCENPPEAWTPGLGLRQMRMRAGLLGATLNFRPSGQGVVVEIILPD